MGPRNSSCGNAPECARETLRLMLIQTNDNLSILRVSEDQHSPSLHCPEAVQITADVDTAAADCSSRTVRALHAAILKLETQHSLAVMPPAASDTGPRNRPARFAGFMRAECYSPASSSSASAESASASTVSPASAESPEASSASASSATACLPAISSGSSM